MATGGPIDDYLPSGPIYGMDVTEPQVLSDDDQIDLEVCDAAPSIPTDESIRCEPKIDCSIDSGTIESYRKQKRPPSSQSRSLKKSGHKRPLVRSDKQLADESNAANDLKRFRIDTMEVRSQSNRCKLVEPSTLPSAIQSVRNDTIDLLNRIFPQHRAALIQTVLDSHSGDPMKTIEHLLTFKDDSTFAIGQHESSSILAPKSDSTTKPRMRIASLTNAVSGSIASGCPPIARPTLSASALASSTCGSALSSSTSSSVLDSIGSPRPLPPTHLLPISSIESPVSPIKPLPTLLYPSLNSSQMPLSFSSSPSSFPSPFGAPTCFTSPPSMAARSIGPFPIPLPLSSQFALHVQHQTASLGLIESFSANLLSDANLAKFRASAPKPIPTDPIHSLPFSLSTGHCLSGSIDSMSMFKPQKPNV